MDKYELNERIHSDSKSTNRKRPINWLEQIHAAKSEEKLNSEIKDNVTTQETSDNFVPSPSKKCRILADQDPTEQEVLSNVNERNAKSSMTLQKAVEMVLEQCSPSNLLEKYFAKGSKWPILNTSLAISNCLSNEMQKHNKILSSVLETLSEKHAKEFLDHAIQENLSSVVCDRLNYQSILDYIILKSKMNPSCCTSLLRHVPEILQHASACSVSEMGQRLPEAAKDNSYQFRFIENLLEKTPFTDDQIFQLINTLITKRQRNLENSN